MVMSSDGKTFKCVSGTLQQVRSLSNISHFQPNYAVRIVKHSDQVMVRGCFNGNGDRVGLVLPSDECYNELSLLFEGFKGSSPFSHHLPNRFFYA